MHKDIYMQVSENYRQRISSYMRFILQIMLCLNAAVVLSELLSLPPKDKKVLTSVNIPAQRKNIYCSCNPLI